MGACRQAQLGCHGENVLVWPITLFISVEKGVEVIQGVDPAIKTYVLEDTVVYSVGSCVLCLVDHGKILYERAMRKAIGDISCPDVATLPFSCAWYCASLSSSASKR